MYNCAAYMRRTELDGGVFSVSRIRLVLPDFCTCGIRQVFPQVTPDWYVFQYQYSYQYYMPIPKV